MTRMIKPSQWTPRRQSARSGAGVAARGRVVAVLALAALLVGILLAVPVARAQDAPRYGEVWSYSLTDSQYEGWLNLVVGLRRDFDQICGDTFCEGDFSNIQSLRYQCSVELATGMIGMCAWTFAASNEAIDPATGRIQIVQRRFWRCRSPLAPRTSIGEFIQALQVEQPLYAPLPHTTRSLMDGLIGCL